MSQDNFLAFAVGIIGKICLDLKLTNLCCLYQEMVVMTQTKVMTPLHKEELKLQFHLAVAPRFNNTLTVKHCPIRAMKIYAQFVKLDASNGNTRVGIIDVHCLKLPCFDSRPFLEES